MKAAARTLLDRLYRLAPLPRVREVVFAAACRLHLVRLDRTRADRAQRRTLLGLVHRARRTRFGREHDFHRIRTPEDFRRLVPLAASARDHAANDPAAGRARRQALRTAFALIHAGRPRLRLGSGRILSLADSLPEAHWPLLLRPSLSAAGPLCCVVGPAARVAAWADSPAVLCTRDAWQESDLQGDRNKRLVLDLVTLPEAAVAVEDPRLGGLRLLADHGVYFEFLPADRVEERQPPRLELSELQTGESYELAITAPGGWWASRSGMFVAFDRLDPPVLRIVPAPAPRPAEEPVPATSPACHRRSDGIPAALPEMTVRSPWSVPSDRG